MNGLDGKVALITGAAGGIGAAAASILAGRGARVVVADLGEQSCTALARQLEGEALALDVTDERRWKQVVAHVLERHGRIDVLVNAAGIVGDVVHGELESTTLAEWRRVLSVNLDGTFLGCREVIGPMRQAGSGSIVNVASVGAYYPTTQSVAYGASKGAVTQLTKSVALYGSRDKKRVRCNSVHPGRTSTAMLDSIMSQYAQRSQPPEGHRREGAREIPLGNEGQPEDVGNLIAFLASDEAGYITGAEFTVDGGWRLMR
jgi:3(or 17)beta-hydroxysteroid dehydrogenase